MRIITVNLELDSLHAIDLLTGNQGLYPSRSELIRVAVRDFLIHQVNHIKTKSIPKPPEPKTEPKPNMVYVPSDDGSEKAYRLVPKPWCR